MTFHTLLKKNLNFTEIITCISKEKLDSYKKFSSSQQDRHALNIYATTQMFSSFLFMPLQFIEITLRNKIHSILCNFYSDAKHNPKVNDPERWLFWMPQSTKIQKKVQEANTAVCKKITDRPILIGDIISALSFNIWVTVLTEQKNIKSPLHFWTHTAKKIFPNAPNRKQSFIIHNLNDINTIRNRLFHYEPIWNTRSCKTAGNIMKDIEKKYIKITEVTGWMSRDINLMLEEIGVTSFFSEMLQYFKGIYTS